MAVEFNHTIVHAYDKQKSANFLSEILGLPAPEAFGFFLVVRTSNRVSLDFIETKNKIEPQHYAFRVSEAEFEQIFSRIKAKALPYWADPAKKQAGEIYHYEDGRGVYFEDPAANFMEILTWSYGG